MRIIILRNRLSFWGWGFLLLEVVQGVGLLLRIVVIVTGMGGPRSGRLE